MIRRLGWSKLLMLANLGTAIDCFLRHDTAGAVLCGTAAAIIWDNRRNRTQA